MIQTPILTIRLYDIKVPNDVRLFTQFLVDAKELAKRYLSAFEAEGVSPEIFHNKNIRYSGIQFSRCFGVAVFSAIGASEVKALKLWFHYFKEESNLSISNVEVIHEDYVPSIGNELFKYKATQLLIKKEIDHELRNLKNTFAVQDRLSKYLYGNIKSFLVEHLETSLTPEDYITVKVESVSQSGHKDTYHRGRLVAYNITFNCNVYLPRTLRVGQSIALGYGRITHR